MSALHKSKYKSGWIQDCTFVTVTTPPPTVKGIHRRTVCASRASCPLAQTMNWVGLLGVGVLLLDLGKPGLLRRGRPGGEGPPGKARESGL